MAATTKAEKDKGKDKAKDDKGGGGGGDAGGGKLKTGREGKL
jgi:hypothetical protein